MSNLLTAGELLDLTGTSSTKKQTEILLKHGINPLLKSNEKLAVSWAAVNAKMMGVEVNTEETPNWGAVGG